MILCTLFLRTVPFWGGHTTVCGGLANNIMPNYASSNTQFQASRGGGRVASDRYRQSLVQCTDFVGLEESTNRYDLLLLVKKVGRAAGFSPRAIQLLDYYMAFTRDVDWEEGSRPIVYQSLARTALDMGVTERQIQKLEQQLFNVGAVTWNDSGNHKRYGQREAQTGRILYAYGVDLTPLAYLKTELEHKLHEKQLYDQAWMETKRQVSWYRAQVRALLLEFEVEEGTLANATYASRYAEIDVQIRTHLDLSALRTLLDRHKCLHSDLTGRVGDQDAISTKAAQRTSVAQETHLSSSRSEQKFAHYKSTTYQSFDKSNTNSPAGSGFQKSVPKSTERKAGYEKNEAGRKQGGISASRDDLILATGLQHITLKQTLSAASQRFREQLPIEAAPMSWSDVIEAAYRLRPQLHISQQSWGETCEIIGRTGAAICVLLTDRAAHREEQAVTRPAAYFRALLNKARAGELRLHSSIFGLVDYENALGKNSTAANPKASRSET